MKLFDKLMAFVEQLPKALENLSGAIRDASAEKQVRNQNPDRVSAEIRFPIEVENAQGAAQNEQIRLQRWTARWAGLAFVAAAAYAFISLCQWQEMQRQTVEANRAWISIDAPTFQQIAEIGKPVAIQIPYSNVGRRPGLNAKFSTLIDVIDTPAVNGVFDATKLPKVGEGFCETNRPDIQAGSVFAEPHPATLRKSSGDFGILWTPQMQRDEKLLRVRACVAYETFDKPRHTWACKVFWSGSFVTDHPGVLIGFNCPDGGGAN
jgi:hypothetical protein